MGHNMNPFGFVPFPEVKPAIRTVESWQGSGTLLTGWIEAKITALTPVHIVGRQEPDEKYQRIVCSRFHRRHGQAHIPSSSIRGMLRAFIEAACNGWASQLTPFYKKEFEKRQIGFQVVDSREAIQGDKDRNKIDSDFWDTFSLPDGLAMPQKFSDAAGDVEVDLASFLFGYIPPQGDAFHGRITIEEAPISEQNISFGNGSYMIPDIDSDAFMGGGKPSASSWWYQKPYQIRLRPTSRRDVVDFVGRGYRGRKFYYHQNPTQCTVWYREGANWPKDSERPLYFFPIECLVPGSSTEPFRIYFEDIPDGMMKLLMLALCPGKRLRHKLGYGKAYGYGSIEFTLLNSRLRGKRTSESSDPDIQKMLRSLHSSLWQKDQLNASGIGGYLEWESLESLAKIMWYAEDPSPIFTYPPFNPGYQVSEKALKNMKARELSGNLKTALANLKGGEVCTEKDLVKLLKRDCPELTSNDKRIIREITLCAHGGFLPVVSHRDLDQVLNDRQRRSLASTMRIGITEAEAREIASKLAGLFKRPALHFDVYQESGTGYDLVRRRRLMSAET